MRKDSLKEKLRAYIKGYQGEQVPHWQLMNCVKSWGYRESNAERRLREMIEIEKIYEHNCIKFYKWRETASQNQPQAERNDKVDQWLSQWKKEPVTEFSQPPTLW